jgi:hypothetical protein
MLYSKLYVTEWHLNALKLNAVTKTCPRNVLHGEPHRRHRVCATHLVGTPPPPNKSYLSAAELS